MRTNLSENTLQDLSTWFDSVEREAIQKIKQKMASVMNVDEIDVVPDAETILDWMLKNRNELECGIIKGLLRQKGYKLVVPI